MFVLIIFLTFFVCVYSDKESCLPLSSCKCKHSKGIKISNGQVLSIPTGIVDLFIDFF